MATIFLVEDEENIRQLVAYALDASGLATRGFADGAAFFAALEGEKPAAVLLDIMLPGQSGLDILKALRRREDTRRTPVMMLTAKGEEYDKVLGLDAGADDYLAKPFGMMELVSRVKALLRRAGYEQAPQEELRVGTIALLPQKHAVTVNGAPVTLTLKEYELLLALARHPGRVFSRDALLETVWGYRYEGETRTVDVHVRSLRQKLGGASGMLETVRGVGYRIREDEP